ncbi:hypothetical protein JVU11DRAFT_6521 [Chiua virens]|nr:hypothetical protein JVU11DRAFT_6521 [Chiua virens]
MPKPVKKQCPLVGQQARSSSSGDASSKACNSAHPSKKLLPVIPEIAGSPPLTALEDTPNDPQVVSTAKDQPTERRCSKRNNVGTGGHRRQLELVGQGIESTPLPKSRFAIPDDEPVNVMAPTPRHPKKNTSKTLAGGGPKLVPQPNEPEPEPACTLVSSQDSSRFGFKLKNPPKPAFIGTQTLDEFKLPTLDIHVVKMSSQPARSRVPTSQMTPPTRGTRNKERKSSALSFPELSDDGHEDLNQEASQPKRFRSDADRDSGHQFHHISEDGACDSSGDEEGEGEEGTNAVPEADQYEDYGDNRGLYDDYDDQNGMCSYFCSTRHMLTVKDFISNDMIIDEHDEIPDKTRPTSQPPLALPTGTQDHPSLSSTQVQPLSSNVQTQHLPRSQIRPLSSAVQPTVGKQASNSTFGLPSRCPTGTPHPQVTPMATIPSAASVVECGELSHHVGDERVGVKYNLLTCHHMTNCRRHPPSPGYLDSVHGGQEYQSSKKRCKNLLKSDTLAIDNEMYADNKVDEEPENADRSDLEESPSEDVEASPKQRRGHYSKNPKGSIAPKPTTMAFYPE